MSGIVDLKQTRRIISPIAKITLSGRATTVTVSDVRTIFEFKRLLKLIFPEYFATYTFILPSVYCFDDGKKY